MTAKTIATEIARVANGAASAAVARVETASPGEIVTYDPETQTASVRLVIRARRRLASGDVQHVERRPLVSVPVQWPGGASAGLCGALSPGDPVVVVFTSRDSSRWLQGAAGYVDAASTQRHGLQGAYVLPGAFPLARVTRPDDSAPSAGVCLYGSESDPVYLGRVQSDTAVAVDTSVEDELRYLRDRLAALEASYVSHTHTVPGVMVGAATVPTLASIEAAAFRLSNGIARAVRAVGSSVAKVIR